MRYSISYWCVSHIGNVRSVNQDNLVYNRSFLPINKEKRSEPICGKEAAKDLFILGVFDGLGGEECGEVASYIAAKTAAEIKPKKNPALDILAYHSLANQKICDYAVKNSVSAMGTTAAMLTFTEKKIILSNVGDSRVYRFDGDELKQLSVDHVSVSAFGMKPPLSQNLGIPPTEMIIDPYLLELPYKDNDLYLICSDGLTDMVKNEEIAEILKNELPGDAIESLLSKALKAGGRDNITIILCKIKRESIWSLFGIGKGSGKGESK